MSSRNYRDLIVWQKSMDMAEDVYRSTRTFPVEERYGMTAQLRRAAVSVPSNIAEGQGRRTAGEFRQALSVENGSRCEIETQVDLATRLGYLGPDVSARLMSQAEEVGRLLTGLVRGVAQHRGQE